MSRHQRHRGLRLILAGGVVLLAADLAVWLLWATRWLLLIGVGGAVIVLWNGRRHRLSVLPSRQVIRGAVINDDAELHRLRDDNAKLRAKVRVLSDMINGGPEERL